MSHELPLPAAPTTSTFAFNASITSIVAALLLGTLVPVLALTGFGLCLPTFKASVSTCGANDKTSIANLMRKRSTGHAVGLRVIVGQRCVIASASSKDEVPRSILVLEEVELRHASGHKLESAWAPASLELAKVRYCSLPSLTSPPLRLAAATKGCPDRLNLGRPSATPSPLLIALLETFQ